MGTPAVTFDMSTAIPVGEYAVPSPASTLQSAVSYGAQQDPNEYAHRLDLQKKLGIPPVVSQGNEKQVQQLADVGSINYSQFAAANPRTTAWGSNPDNAAVAGVNGLQSQAQIEQNAMAMRVANAQAAAKASELSFSNFHNPFSGSTQTEQPEGGVRGPNDGFMAFKPEPSLWSTVLDVLKHSTETLLGADTPQQAAAKQQLIAQTAAEQPNNQFFKSIQDVTQTLEKPLLNPSGTKVFQGLLNPQSRNVFSRSLTGATKSLEGLTSVNNLSLLASTPLAPEDAAPLISGVFSGQMAEGAVDSGTQAARSVYQGNYGDAAEETVGAGASALFAVGAGKHALTERISAQLPTPPSPMPAVAPEFADTFRTSPFLSNLAGAVDASESSPLAKVSPDKFHEANQANFEGDRSYLISQPQFAEQLASKGIDPASVARNYPEAVMSGGDVEVPRPDFHSLDPETQKALLPDVKNPEWDMTAREFQEGSQNAQKWFDEGGLEKLSAQMDAADAETASSPDFQAVKEGLRQRYVDAGEDPEVAETLATKDANVYSNLARNVGMKPSELVALYNPKVVTGEAPAAAGDVTTAAEQDDARPAATSSEAPEAEAALHQSSEDGARGWFRVLPDGTYEIGKTSIGDLSTFVHEPAHAYLRMIGDLAKRDGASDVLKGDYQKVLDYLGAKGGEPFTPEQQEKFARANEQYLREGKAPSSSLKGAFQRFAIWLGSVYKHAKDLGVTLSDDIRGVFDRLYASEDGVDKAAAENGPKLFNSAEEAGWTDEQFQKYADAKGMEVEQAKAEILAKLNEAALREQTDAWRSDESNARAAITAEVDQSRVYSAIRSLRRGSLDDGTAMTMSRDELVKQFGEDRVKGLQKQHPGLYRNEGGLEPETAAEMLGFDSAENMMKAVETSPRRGAAIEQGTRDYMTAKHGDIRYDGSLQEKAQVALMNEQRAESLHRELDALNRRNNPEFELRVAQRELRRYAREQADSAKQQGRLEARDQKIEDLKKKISDLQFVIRSSVEEGRAGNRTVRDVAPLEAYRDTAHEMVESKAVADLQPARYLDASRVYSREAIAALGKGDYEAAKQAKHKELMNHFLFREATKAKEYIGKFESYVKRVTGDAVQKKLGLAGGDYRDQFNRLLGRYQLGQDVKTDRPLAAWAQEQYDAEKMPAIDPIMFDESRGANYRNTPLAEIRSLHDALVNIRKLANLDLGNTVNGRRIEFASSMAAMEQRARESLKSSPRPVFDYNRTAGESAADLVNRGPALLNRMEFLITRLDGGKEGPWHDFLFNLSSDAQGRENALHRDVTEKAYEGIRNMPKEQRAHLEDKVIIQGISEPVTRKTMIAMALNMGNESNLDRMTKTFYARGWDAEAIEKVKNSLTREEWQFVQNMWNILKPLGKEQAELERRQTGLPPVMIEPTPVHVTHADGTESHLDGGYYPVDMASKDSVRGAQQGQPVQSAVDGDYTRVTTSRGNMKERTGYGGPLRFDYEQTLTQHTAKVIKDISSREFTQVASKILTDPQIRKVLQDTLGAANEEQMMPWLRTIVNDRNGSTVQGLGIISRVLNGSRTNIVKAALGLKFSTTLLQLTHASSVFLHTTPSRYAQALIDFVAHPTEMSQQIRDLSPNEMANRGENIDRDMRKVMQDTRVGDKSISDHWATIGMAPVKFMDHMLSFPLWKAVYDDALEVNSKLPEEQQLSDSEAKYQAMHKADGAVRMGLGSNAPKDLAPIMRNNDVTKLLTTMGGFHNLKYNQIAGEVNAFRNGGSAANLTYGLIMAAIIPAVLGSYISGRGPKDDENTGEWAAKRALLFPLETMAILNIAVDAIENGSDMRYSPIASDLERGRHAASAALKPDEGDKDWTGIGMDSLQTAMEFYGVSGTDQAFKIARYARRAQQGKIADPNLHDAVLGEPRR